jgi:hypothetical protein
MLSHHNLVSNTLSSLERLPFTTTSDSSAVLSYLPLAHMIERIGAYLYTGAGATIYYVDDLTEIAANTAHLFCNSTSFIGKNPHRIKIERTRIVRGKEAFVLLGVENG